MKRKKRERRKFTDPENNMGNWLEDWDGEKENQLMDLHGYEKEKKEEWEGAFEDEYSDFVMPEDFRVDLGLPIVLLQSTQLCSSSTTKNEYSSGEIPHDEKMKRICTDSVNPLRTFGSETFSVREVGEPSCGYCVICDDAKPIRSILRSYCRHYFCEDCFRIYLGEKLQENILSVKCPEKGCKKLLEATFWSRYVPEEVLDRWKEAYLEGSILVSPVMIVCPCCFRKFVDDGRDFLIRACTKCWKIFCMNCRVRWHMGMGCEQFQLHERMKIWNSKSRMLVLIM